MGGLAALGRIVQLVSIGVNVGLGIDEIFYDPKSAPMAIVGMLGGGFTRN